MLGALQVQDEMRCGSVSWRYGAVTGQRLAR